MFNFMPREEDFFSLFQQSSKNVIEGGRLLKELMDDYQDVQEKVGRIKDVEHQGDDITHDIVRRLNQTFITPLDREDIHDLTSALDDVLDEIDAVADLFLIYKISRKSRFLGVTRTNFVAQLVGASCNLVRMAKMATHGPPLFAAA